MSTPVNLPALGESVTEGTITRWLKQVGDTVEVDEPLLEVSTDKVDTEIPSPVAGTLLEIKAEEDETVEVGAELCVIGDEGEGGGSVGLGLRGVGGVRREPRTRATNPRTPATDDSGDEAEETAEDDEDSDDGLRRGRRRRRRPTSRPEKPAAKKSGGGGAARR